MVDCTAALKMSARIRYEIGWGWRDRMGLEEGTV